VFADPLLMLRKDRVVDGEQRWHGIGAVQSAWCMFIETCLSRGKPKWRRSHPYHLGPGSRFAWAPNLSKASRSLNARRPRSKALPGDRSARTRTGSTIPIFGPSPTSSSPSSVALPKGWWRSRRRHVRMASTIRPRLFLTNQSRAPGRDVPTTL